MTTRALQITELITPVVDPTTGSIADGYDVYFYSAGTSNAKNVWTEPAKTNPFTTVELGSGAWETGTAQVYGDGNYKIIIKNADATTVLEWDDVKVEANNFSVVTKSGAYTATPDDDVILVNSSGGNVTISLETVANFVHPITIKKIHADNSVIIDPNGAQTIDGDTTVTLTAIYQTLEIYPDTTATTWRRAYDSLSADLNTLIQLLPSPTHLTTPFNRSNFTYNGGATAYTMLCRPANYWCKDKYCYWDSELTTGAIGTPGADDFYYLYLDYSAITSGTQITNSELIWSNTEPVWNDTYRASMNGDDRCIFGILTNSGPTNILAFSHDSDFVSLDSQITDYASGTPGDTYTDVSLSIPKFSLSAQVTFQCEYSNADAAFFWRTNGTNGVHTAGYVDVGGDLISELATRVVTDSSQIIEVKSNGASTNIISVFLDGWYLPTGL